MCIRDSSRSSPTCGSSCGRSPATATSSPSPPRSTARAAIRPTSSCVRRRPARDGDGLAGAVERIAHYRILKRIGRGGMGIVYQAVDERDERTVALKVIREAEAPGDESAAHLAEARVRFDREAAILNSFLHVNVVAFFEIGEEDGTPW